MEVQDIIKKLTYRRYPKEIILHAFDKVTKLTRDSLLEKDMKKMTDKKIQLITTYNVNNPPMKDILQRHREDFIQNKTGLTCQNIQTVYRSSRNLRDKLVRGNIKRD